MRIARSNAEALAGWRRQQVLAAPGRRLRGLVAEIDAAITACEEAHLNGRVIVPEDVLRRATRAFLTAALAVDAVSGPHATRMVMAIAGRPAPRISTLMATLWDVESVVFDLLVPWRAPLMAEEEAEERQSAVA